MLSFADKAQVLGLNQIVHILLTLVQNLILQPVALGLSPLFRCCICSLSRALLFGLTGNWTHVRKIGRLTCGFDLVHQTLLDVLAPDDWFKVVFFVLSLPALSE